jgi:flavorubredoxin
MRLPLKHLFSRMGVQVGATIESFGRPNEAVLEACRELGRQLAGQAGG